MTTTIADAVLHVCEGRTLTLEDIAVRMWENDRRRFCLPGYEDHHPDPRKAACAIMGRKGLVAAGLLSQHGKLYSLTEAGRQRLHGGPQEALQATPAANGQTVASNGQQAPQLTPQADALLQRLLASEAWNKWYFKERDAIHFRMACDFWGVVEGMAGRDALDVQLDWQATELHVLRGNGPCTRADGSYVSKEELVNLCALHDWMIERFARHLNLLRNRKNKGDFGSGVYKPGTRGTAKKVNPPSSAPPPSSPPS